MVKLSVDDAKIVGNRSDRGRVQIYFEPDSSLTMQNFAAECDISNIMRSFAKTGLVNHVNRYQGQYGDFADAPTYHEAMNIIVEAQDAFDSLPANLRAKFANDPAQFLDFVHNPENEKEMIELGLANPSQAIENNGDFIKTNEPQASSTSSST